MGDNVVENRGCRVTWSAPSALMVVLAVAGCDGTGRGRAMTSYGQTGHYEPSVGRVGYHMTAGLRAYNNDPVFYCNGAYNDDAKVTRGTLPPGLTMNHMGDISGTPRQPGQWNFDVVLYGSYCENPYQAPIDLKYSTTFTILP